MFPVYDLNAHEHHDDAFGQLADLFADEAKVRPARRNSVPSVATDLNPVLNSPGTDTVDHILVKDIMQLAFAWEFLCGENSDSQIFVNKNGDYDFGRDCENGDDDEYMEDDENVEDDGNGEDDEYMEDDENGGDDEYMEDDENGENDETGEKAIPKYPRKVSVVMMGIFQLEEIQLPAVCEASRTCLVINRVRRSSISQQPDGIADTSEFCIMSLLRGMHEVPPFFNHHDTDCPTPWPPLQFMEFVLRRHLGLRFADAAFSLQRDIGTPRPYLQLVQNGNIFYEEHDLVPGLFVNAKIPPVNPNFAELQD